MVASNDTKDLKARLLDLNTSVLKMVQDGKRDIRGVCEVLQIINDHSDFREKFVKSEANLRLGASRKKEIARILKEWHKFYHEVFGTKVDFSRLRLPEERGGFNWLVLMAEGLTLNQIWQKLSERMPSYKYWDDLDQITSDRNTDKDYAIRIRDRVEADEELKNESADDLKREGVVGITLPERLILELFYHWRTGNHLDIQNVTYCACSHDPDGDVPHVSWGGGKLCLGWYYADFRGDDLRSRQVVL